MEYVVKITISLVVIVLIYYQLCILKWTWSNQIDPKATLSKLLKKAKPDTEELIAVRDPDKIYQDGAAVGDVTGDVVVRGDTTIFKELCNTRGLKIDMQFEYRRDKYRIESIGSTSVLGLIARSGGQGERKEHVKKEVVCRKVN
jgi:hypothetical protein